MRRFLFVIFVVTLILSIFTSPIEAYSTNMSASVVVGEPDFASSTSGTSNTLFGLGLVRGISVDPMGRLMFADQQNNRVLVWNKVPTTNGAPADLVLGQADFVSGSVNRGGTTNANTLNLPLGVYSDGTRLVVTDGSNNRVLIWNTFPTSNGQPADVVVGKSSMTDRTTTTCDASHLLLPFASWIYNGKLLVTERSQSAAGRGRVLIWNSVPTSNGTSADVVLGQPNLTTCTAGGTTTQNTFNEPRGIMIDQNGRLFVADFLNHRVLIWNSFPTVNQQAADVVIGQNDFVSATTGTSANLLKNPVEIYSTGTRLFIADAANSRILIYNSIPTTNGANADLTIGQPSLVNGSSNFSGSVQANTIATANSVFVRGNQLFVGDSGNDRILIFNDTAVTPAINLASSPALIDGSGRYRLTGNVFMNKNSDAYALQTLQADVNATGYGQIATPGGHDDGGGNTITDFIYDFNPSVGLGNINNLTLKFLATTTNNDTNTLFYFLPFNFSSFNVSNTKSQNFTFSVNKDQLQRVKDNLDHFEVWYKPNTTKGVWTNYISNVGKDKIDTNGLVSYNNINGTKFIGSYIFKITAVDNWNNKEDSNYLYIAGTTPIILTSHPSFGMNFVTPVPSASPISQAVTTPSPLSTPTVTPEVVPVDTGNTQTTTFPIKYYIFFGGLIIILVIGFLIVLLKRRK